MTRPSRGEVAQGARGSYTFREAHQTTSLFGAEFSHSLGGVANFRHMSLVQPTTTIPGFIMMELQTKRLQPRSRATDKPHENWARTPKRKHRQPASDGLKIFFLCRCVTIPSCRREPMRSIFDDKHVCLCSLCQSGRVRLAISSV